jgi:hypothetical protein
MGTRNRGRAASATQMQDDYILALARLNRAVVDFNRDMSSPPVDPK